MLGCEVNGMKVRQSDIRQLIMKMGCYANQEISKRKAVGSITMRWPIKKWAILGREDIWCGYDDSNGLGFSRSAIKFHIDLMRFVRQFYSICIVPAKVEVLKWMNVAHSS